LPHKPGAQRDRPSPTGTQAEGSMTDLDGITHPEAETAQADKPAIARGIAVGSLLSLALWAAIIVGVRAL
jgi:hypothetical protein